jgi:hypothetical protein
VAMTGLTSKTFMIAREKIKSVKIKLLLKTAAI